MSWYASDVQNLTLNDVRNVLRETGLPYTPASIPVSAVNIPLVTTLPNQADDRAQVFLKTGSTVDHYIYLKSIPAWVRLNDTVNQSIVTALPASPSEGDQIVYDTGTAGVRWHFVYDSSDGTTYPWLFIGGAPLSAEVTTSQSTTSTSYAALATAGPSVTAPLAGDYDVMHGCTMSTTNEIGFHSYDIGGTGAADGDSVRMGAGGGDQGSHTRRRRKTSISASTAFVSKYRSFGGASVTFLDRHLSIVPVRVG